MTKTIQKIIKNGTEYNIKDTTYESKTAVSGGTAVSLVTTGEKYDWNNKQATLVSGTNIKTINNESLLGSGNITISGGGGADIEYVTEDEYDEISGAESDGKNYFIVEPFTASLLTYAEIKAMADDEGYPRTSTIAELNTAPADYYDYLVEEGYYTSGYYIDGISGTLPGPFPMPAGISYDAGNNIRQSGAI